MVKKILFISLIFYLFTSVCYALDVTVVDRSGNPVTIVNNKLVTSGLGSNVVSGQNNNIATGSAVALGSSTSIFSVTIRAGSANDNYVYVGPSTVSTSNGYVLATNSTVTLNTDNLADIYIISGGGGNNDINAISYIAEIQ